jgi:hypothetical protein
VLAFDYSAYLLRSPAIDFARYNELSIIMYVKLRGFNHATQLLSNEHFGLCTSIFTVPSRELSVELSEGTVRVDRFAQYKSRILKWTTNWNEIIITVKGIKDIDRALFIMYFNGKKEVMPLRKTRYWYSHPVLRNDRLIIGRSCELKYRLNGVVRILDGWMANVIVVNTIMDGQEITGANCKY